MPPLTGRLCRQTQAASLGQILIVLNRWDVTANDRRSIPLKSRTYVDVAAGDKRLPQRQAIGMCSALRSNHGPQLRKAEGDWPPQIDSDRCEPPRRGARLRFRWRTPWRASLSVRENAPQRCDQTIKFDRRAV